MNTKEQNISPIKQRILLFAGTLGISKRDFYAKIGVSRGTLESKTGITEDVVTKFFATYPQVSVEWLMTGVGPMIKTKCNQEAQRTPVQAIRDGKVTNNIDDTQAFKGKSAPSVNATGPTAEAHQAPRHTNIGIPLIPIDAIAGFPADSSATYLEDCDRYVIPEFESKGASFLIRVSGDSMVPLYYSGDLLACRKISDIRFFQWGTVYVLETSQGVIVKRVQESTDHTDCILCVSENHDVHKPFLLPRDDIRSLSTIIGLVRMV